MNNRDCSSRSFLPLCTALMLVMLAGRARADISDHVQYKKLANGLQVLVLENHKAPVATLNVFYHVGSRNERFGQTGISPLTRFRPPVM